MSFEIKLNVSDSLKSIPEKLDKGILVATEESTTLVNNTAINNAHRVFGNLKRSIHPEVVVGFGSFTGKVIQDSTVAKYGIMVEEGTGIYHEPDARQPWTITPQNKKALAFKIGGEFIIRKKVIIKGQKAQFFMRKALQDNKENIKKIYQTKINNVIGGK